MRKYTVPMWIVLAILTLFWAYTVIDTLLSEFAANVTFLDLGVLVILGFIAGLAVGLAVARR